MFSRRLRILSGFRFLILLVTLALVTASLNIHPAHAAKTVVTYWTWNAANFDTAPDGTMRPQKAAFDAANPDIDLQVKVYSYTDYLSQLQLNMASGLGPDIVAMQAGALMNTYKEFFVDLGPLAQKTWGEKWADRFLPLGLNKTRRKDAVAGLPLMNLDAGFMWINTQLLNTNSRS